MLPFVKAENAPFERSTCLGSHPGQESATIALIVLPLYVKTTVFPQYLFPLPLIS
jgi:hypothetical protein